MTTEGVRSACTSTFLITVSETQLCYRASTVAS